MSDEPQSGSGSSTKPSGSQERGGTTKPCEEANGTGWVYVWVEEGLKDGRSTVPRSTYKRISGAEVELSPKGDKKPTADGLACFGSLDPGKYSAKLSIAGLKEFEGAEIVRDNPVTEDFDLAAGDDRRVTFLVCPLTTKLIVQVVDQDTDQVISDRKFRIVSAQNRIREDSDLNGSKTLQVEPGDYSDITVELEDGEQKQLYRVMGEAKDGVVKRGETKVLKVKLAVKKLRLTSVDPYFAPSKEDLVIRYEIGQMQGERVWLTIYEGQAVLYERELSNPEKEDGKHEILWGKNDTDKINQPGHPLHGRFVNPLFSPYRVVLVHPITQTHRRKEEHELEFSVRLHSIELEWMSWADVYKEVTGGDEYPVDYRPVKALNDNNKKLLWAKCRLNEIGYSAGPVNKDQADPDFLKAVRRYGAMRGINGKTLTPMMSEAEVAALADLGPNGFPLDDLIEHLAREKRLVVEPLANKDQLCQPDDPSKPLKLYIDATRFYRNTDWNPDKTLEESVGELSELFKYAVEANWFSRPIHALRARIRIKTKNNSGEYLPDLVKDVSVSWSWKDAPESVEALPDPQRIGRDEANDFNYAANANIATVYGKPECRSKARTYLDRVRQHVKRTLGDAGYNENARTDFGGVITNSRQENSAVVFAPFQRADRSRAVFEKRDEVASGAGGVAAEAVVYFRPSLIAGDHYRITAQVEAAQQRRSGIALSSQEQQALERLNNFGALQVTTGTIQAWRRVRVSAFVDWPKQEKVWDSTPREDKPFNFDAMWNGVQKEFAFSYLELTPCRPGATTVKRCRPSEITLLDDDYRDKGQKILRNGTKVPVGLADCVRGSINKVGGLIEQVRACARDLYTDPDTNEKDRVEVTDEAILPRVQTKKMQVDPDKPLEVNPPNGDVPSLSRILQYFLPNLKTLLAEAKKGWTGANGNYNQALLADVWFLALAWRSYDPGKGPLHREIQKAGAYIAGELAKYVRLSPRCSPGGVLKRTGALGTDKPVLEWVAGASDNPPAIAYVEAPAFDYGQENFPELMRLLLLPESNGYRTVSKELNAWATDETKVDAPRTASVCNLLAGLAKAVPGQSAFIDFVLFYVWQHYLNSLQALLETSDVPASGKTLKMATTGKFKANVTSATDRQVPPFLKTPGEIDESFIGPIVGNAMKALGEDWAVPFDHVVRKGLLCRRDGEYYTDFAEGMIIVNARINKTYKVGARQFSIAGTSEGMTLGVVFVSHYTPMEPYALFAHEIGHVLFMEHYQNSGGDLGFDHDRSDGNCIMSYPNLEVPDPVSFDQLTAGDRSALHGLKLKRLGEWPTAIDTIRGMTTQMTLTDGTGPQAKLHNPTNAPFKEAKQFNIYSATLTGILPRGARFTGPGTRQVHTVTEDCTAVGNRIDGVKSDPEINANESTKWQGDALITFRADYGVQLRKRISIANFGQNMLAKIYRPHYCGKCSLKLRGWDIYAANNTANLLPQYSENDLPDNPPFAGLQTLPPPQASAPTALAKTKVRLIPGTVDDSAPAADDQALGTVGISFYPSDLTGRQTAAKSEFKAKTPELKAFPTTFGYNADAAADPGAFRVEVIDPNVAADRVYVTLEAWKPVYSGGRFTNGWEDFAGEERKKRALVHVECRPIGDSGDKAHCYRSRYMRLVTDEEDFACLAPTKQGLLVTDLADGAGAGNDQVEILDQQVRITYDPTPP